MQVDSLPAEPPGKPKNTAVRILNLLQRIFPTQELNYSLLHCRRILYQLSYQGSPVHRVRPEILPLSSIPPFLSHCTYSEVAQSCLTLCNPVDCSLPRSSVHGIFPGKRTGVGCHFLLQRIFPTQGSNLGVPHCRQTLCHLSHHGSPGEVTVHITHQEIIWVLTQCMQNPILLTSPMLHMRPNLPLFLT